MDWWNVDNQKWCMVVDVKLPSADGLEWTGGMLTIKNGLVVLPSADGRVGFMQPLIRLNLRSILT